MRAIRGNFANCQYLLSNCGVPSDLSLSLSLSSPHLRTLFHCFYRERKGEEREKEREKHGCNRNIDWLPLVGSQTRDQTCSPGTCPDRELNPRPSGTWNDAPTTSFDVSLLIPRPPCEIFPVPLSPVGPLRATHLATRTRFIFSSVQVMKPTLCPSLDEYQDQKCLGKYKVPPKEREREREREQKEHQNPLFPLSSL